MKRKEAMSETTSEPGQAELAGEPSMEDILASIRKIIADDDQAMDIAEPQALDNPSFDAAPDIKAVSENLTSGLNIEDETALSEPSVFDENSIFKDLRGPSEAEGASEPEVDLSGDVMDLDIEALLKQAETPAETIADNASETVENTASAEDDIFDMMDLEIPDAEPEVEIETLDTTTENIADASILELVETVEAEAESQNTTSELTHDSSFVAEEEGDDSLFDELESLLADAPEADEAPDTKIASEAIATEAPGGNIQENVAKKGLFGAGLAAIGLGAAGKAAIDSSEPPVGDNAVVSDETEAALLLSSENDDDLDALLDDLISIDDAEIPKTDAVELETSLADDETIITEADVPSLNTDETDMNLVKSLMADLTEPEGEAPEVEVAEANEAAIDIDQMLEASLPAADITEENIAELQTDDAPDDILDDILNMNLDDEIATHEDEAATDTLEEMLEIPTPEDDTPTAEFIAADEAENTSENSSLMDIALAAEQDADALENPATSIEDEPAIIELPTAEEVDAEIDPKLAAGLSAGVLGAAAIVAKEAAENKRNATSEDDAQTQETDTQKETADMPRAAAKKETILDDVTETAAAGAFASLNQVVEEKAIKAERGDRIGDIVMEALQPMLKEWLDANLKTIVERAVTKEVKRISSGK